MWKGALPGQHQAQLGDARRAATVQIALRLAGAREQRIAVQLGHRAQPVLLVVLALNLPGTLQQRVIHALVAGIVVIIHVSPARYGLKALQLGPVRLFARLLARTSSSIIVKFLVRTQWCSAEKPRSRVLETHVDGRL